MTDRPAKRLRRLSTEYDDAEDINEWNNSRYVAGLASTERGGAPSFAVGPAQLTARHKAAGVGASRQSAAGAQQLPQANAMTAHHRPVPPAP